MTTSDLEGHGTDAASRENRRAAPAPGGEGRAAPARPSLLGKDGAPVVVKLPPPFSVRLSQLCWILSLVVGAIGVVYLFIIRQPLQPEISGLVRTVQEGRAEETYTTAADIVYWTGFGCLVAILLVQVTMLVSFANRRRHVRWWMLGTLVFQAAVFFAVRELIALGERGEPLEQVLLGQLALALLGLLFSVLPGALRWTARQHDVRRGGYSGPAGGDL